MKLRRKEAINVLIQEKRDNKDIVAGRNPKRRKLQYGLLSNWGEEESEEKTTLLRTKTTGTVLKEPGVREDSLEMDEGQGTNREVNKE